MDGDIPVLDITGFSDDPWSLTSLDFVDELGAAMHHYGFAYLEGHGVDPALDIAVHDIAREFFEASDNERAQIAVTNSPHVRGHTRLGMEHGGTQPDWREIVEFGPERRPVTPVDGQPAWLCLRGPNQWPHHIVADFQPVITAWMAELDRVSRWLLRALALALGQPIDRFDSAVLPDPEVLVRMIRYPAAPVLSRGTLGKAVHHDLGLITLVHHDAGDGLQMWHDDAYLDIPARPGAYVLNLGDIMRRASRGYFRAARHRVVSPTTSRERLALAYFFNPSLEASMPAVDLPEPMARQLGHRLLTNDGDAMVGTFGDVWLTARLLAHPDVAALHHPELFARMQLQARRGSQA
ncbi:MAG: 2-oxoglutarate and iron-dependent oxygenase domain-containing protein [Actinomycetota bacterium]